MRMFHWMSSGMMTSDQIFRVLELKRIWHLPNSAFSVKMKSMNGCSLRRLLSPDARAALKRFHPIICALSTQYSTSPGAADPALWMGLIISIYPTTARLPTWSMGHFADSPQPSATGHNKDQDEIFRIGSSTVCVFSKRECQREISWKVRGERAWFPWKAAFAPRKRRKRRARLWERKWLTFRPT